MTVTDERRQGLAEKADQVLGNEHGSTLMELLSKSPWENVATKDDVAAVKDDIAALRADVSRCVTRDDLRAELSQFVTKDDLKAELRAELDQFATKDQLRAEIAELKADLQHTMMTWLIGSTTVQTAVIGLLLAIR